MSKINIAETLVVYFNAEELEKLLYLNRDELMENDLSPHDFEQITGLTVDMIDSLISDRKKSISSEKKDTIIRERNVKMSKKHLERHIHSSGDIEEQELKYRDIFAPHSMRLCVRYNGIVGICLVDTGAMSTIISRKFAEQSGLDKFIDTDPRTQVIISGLGGEKNKAGIIYSIRDVELGEKEMKFDIHHVVVSNDEYLAGRYSMIIGYAFMKENKVLISIADSILFCGGEKIQGYEHIDISTVKCLLFTKNLNVFKKNEND